MERSRLVHNAVWYKELGWILFDHSNTCGSEDYKEKHHTVMENKAQFWEKLGCCNIVGYEEHRRLVHKAIWYKERGEV